MNAGAVGVIKNVNNINYTSFNKLISSDHPLKLLKFVLKISSARVKLFRRSQESRL